ncbi:hypothetical protein BVRB_7g165370 [Beta vulgaris subsp. vulgaris]|nr:hypothetical protein BVRB_7g165370 [Beta vulgaris subsp. vulgaris]
MLYAPSNNFLIDTSGGYQMDFQVSKTCLEELLTPAKLSHVLFG